MTADAPLAWSVVVPVKVLALAKSRLTGLAGQRRPELALALAADTVAAALRCPRVTAVIVVSDDDAAVAELSGMGAVVVPDLPGDGLNPALAHGAGVAAALRPSAGIAALAADLPALRPAELGRALRAAGQWPESFVADASGSGTTLYAARPGTPFSPLFGPASRQRHLTGGVTELRLDGIDSLRRDVDTPGDLGAAARLGLGPRTAPIASQLLGLPARQAGPLRSARRDR